MTEWHINNQVDPNISLQWTDRSIDRPINRFSRVMWITQMCVVILRRVHHNIDFPVKRSVNWILHVLSSKNHRSLADWPLGSTRNMFTIYGIVATVSVGFFSSNLCTMYWIRSRKIKLHQRAVVEFHALNTDLKLEFWVRIEIL